MAKKYLSWEVVVRLLRKISVVWRQMRHNIISICYSDCVWHNFAIVSSKYRITDSRLSKCHRLNIFLFLINLGIRKTKRKEKSFITMSQAWRTCFSYKTTIKSQRNNMYASRTQNQQAARCKLQIKKSKSGRLLVYVYTHTPFKNFVSHESILISKISKATN